MRSPNRASCTAKVPSVIGEFDWPGGYVLSCSPSLNAITSAESWDRDKDRKQR